MKKILIALVFMCGVALTGADGAWFPWINLVGVGLVGAIALLAGELR